MEGRAYQFGLTRSSPRYIRKFSTIFRRPPAGKQTGAKEWHGEGGLKDPSLLEHREKKDTKGSTVEGGHKYR